MNRLHEFSSRFRILKGGKISLVVSALLGSAIVASAAPNGGVVTSGNATINQNGNTTNINQSSNKASINWNDFSIKSNETVNFNQPNNNSITLNRVTGNEKSVIDGALNANGQVWILNKNGTLFSKDAKVNTSGLLVTTKELSDEDFNKGNYNFRGDSKASIENNGSINVNDKAYVAFIANTVKNNGKIEVYQGTINLQGADHFSLNLEDTSNISIKVTKGTIDALVENNNLLKADGGKIYLTTNAKDELLKGVVNNTGIIEANSIDNLKSEVVLYAHGGTTNVNGTIKAKDGFIETSGKNLNVTNESTIEAKKWLLDPENVTIDDGTGAIGGSSVGASVIQKALNGSVLPAVTPMDVEIQADNNIDVNADISYGRSTLTLNAGNSVNINKTITLTRDVVKDESGLIIKYAQKVNTGDYYVNNTNGNTGKVNLAVTSSFKTQKGTDAVKNYTVITSLGNQGSISKTDLQGMNGNLNGNYVLGADIDATATSDWNSGKGFISIGGSSIVSDNKTFNGTFDGLGHTITKLTTINDSLNTYGFVGLFGSTSNTADIRNIGLIDTVAKSYFNTGSLVGSNAGRIYNSYSTGTGLVSGSNHIGGLVGNNAGGQILNSYTSIKVEGANQNIGGLVGLNNSGGSISNSYSSSSVSGNAQKIGGLVGLNVANATINDSNSAANVQGNNTSGGLVGENQGEINNSFSKATVNSTGINTGGFAGINAGVINNSYIDGGSFTVSNNTAGGFVGWNQGNGKINNSYSNTTVTSSGEQNVGGFAGANDGTISNSYSNANIELNALNISNIGGLVGKNNGTINSNSYAKANLKTLQSNGTYIAVGGLVGLNSASGKIDGSNSENNLNFNANALGGLVGSNLGNITNSFSTGAIKSSRYFGGLAGENKGTITSSYSTVSLTGVSYFGGLVGENNGGTINNSSYKDATVYGTNTRFGGLVGGNINGGKIINSTSSGNLEGRAPANLFVIGGLVGLNDATSTIDKSYSTMSIKLDNISTTAGGLVGDNLGTITNSNTNLTMEGGSTTGGLVGNNRGSIINSFSAGTIKATDTVGGLVGTNSSGGIIDGTYSNSKITATSNNIGGLVGVNAGEIKNSYIKDATLSATGNTVGGFIGWNRTTGNITNSNSTIVVTSTTGSKIGGFIGANDGTIQNSYTTGAVTGNTSVGGFVGENSGKIYASNSTGAVTGKTTVGGFVGRNFGANGEIEYSYTFGKIDGGTNVGGFAGTNTAIIRNTYTTGNVSGNSIVSSFVGKNEGGSVIYSYARGTILGATSYGFAGDNAGVISDSYYNLTQNPLKDDEALYGKVIGELRYGALYKRADWNITSDASLNIDTPVIKFDANNKGYWAIAPIVANYELGDYGVDYKGDYYNLSQTYTTPFKNFQFLENSLDYEFVRGGATVTQYRDVGKYDNIGVKSTNEFLIIPTSGNTNGSFTINKAFLTIKANNESKVYNGLIQTMNGVTVNGLKGTDTNKDLNITGNSVARKDAGVVSTNLGATNNNYNISFDNGNLTITKANAIVTANSDTKTYNGYQQSVSGFTAQGLVNGETTAVLSGVEGAEINGKDAGVYSSNLIGTDRNYNLTFVNGKLTITKATATVTLEDESRVYNGYEQILSNYKIDGLLGDDKDLELTDLDEGLAKGKDVGTYSSSNLKATDNNYEIVFKGNGNLVITQADLIVRGNSKVTTFNGTDQNINGTEQFVEGYTLNGLLGNDTNDVVTGIIGARAAGTNAGTYYMNMKDGISTNYKLTYENGTLRINKADAVVAVVTGNSASYVYNGQEQSINGFSILVQGISSKQYGDIVVTGDEAKGKDAGIYYTNLSGTSNNYNLTFINGELIITKAKATVTGVSGRETYSGKEQAIEGYTVTGLVVGETKEVLDRIDGDTAKGTNAGTYKTSLTGEDKNYDLTFVDGTLTIDKAKAVVISQSVTKEYNGTNQTVNLDYSITGLQGDDTESVATVNGNTVTGKNVGAYNTNLNAIADNYYFEYEDGALNILKLGSIDGTKKLKVTANSDTKEYNGKDQQVTGFTVSGLLGSDTKADITGVTGDIAIGKNAGIYTTSLAGVDDNYELEFIDGKLDIKKANAIVTGNSSTKVYNGNTQTVSGFTAQGLVNGETTSVLSGISGSVASGKDAGDYYSNLTGTDVNYNLTFVNGKLTIEKAVAKVIANSAEKVYNADTQSISGYTVEGLVNGETSAVLTGITGANASGKDVGIYDTALKGTDKNYILLFTNGELTITPANATVIGNSASKVYNGEIQSIDGYIVTGLLGSDSSSVITGILGDEAKGEDVGVYSTNLYGGISKNYNITYEQGKLAITKAPLRVIANSDTKEYNGYEQTVSGYKLLGLVKGDSEVEITDVVLASGKNVGTYNTNLSGTDENYELTFENGTLTITKADLLVRGNSSTKTYNGLEQSVSGYKVNGLLGDDTASVVSGVTGDSVKGINVGLYEMNLAGGDALNYNISYENGVLNITKADAIVTVTGNSASKVYNGLEQSISGFTVTGLASGETSSILNITGDTAKGTDVGEYFTNLRGNNPNYNISFVDGKLTITKANATVIGVNHTETYNGNLQKIKGYTVEGLVNGEDKSVLDLVEGDLITGTNAGIYKSNLSGEDHNYNLTFKNGTFTITKADATVVANSTSKVYNGYEQSVNGFTVSGLLGDDTIDDFIGVKGAIATGKDVGNYKTNLNGTDKNYNLTFVDRDLIITKANASVIGNITSKVYNGKNQSSGYTLEGLLGNDSIDDLKGINVTTAKDVGRYVIEFSGIDKNYELDFSDGLLTITKAKLIAKANDYYKDWDNEPFYGGNGVTYKGLVNNETGSVIGGQLLYGGNSQGATRVGEYDITIAGLEAKNYDISYENGVLNIEPGTPIIPEDPGTGENSDDGNNGYYNKSNKAEQVSLASNTTLCYDDNGIVVDTVANNMTRSNSDIKSVLICKK